MDRASHVIFYQGKFVPRFKQRSGTADTRAPQAQRPSEIPGAAVSYFMEKQDLELHSY